MTETESVMHSKTAGLEAGSASSWRGFTAGDILAIQNMYGNPTYWVKIVGPAVLGAGKTGTYGISVPDHLKKYVREFRTTWKTNHPEVEVTPTTKTRVDITNSIKGTISSIRITVDVNFNNIWMSNSYDVLIPPTLTIPPSLTIPLGV